MRWIVLGLMGASGPVLACEGLPLKSEGDASPKAVILIDDDLPRARPFGLKVEFCGAADVSGVEIAAVMPAHQHGMNYTPKVMPLGNGLFEVDGMLFHMPGYWEIQVDAQIGAETVSYTYDVMVK